MIVFVNRFAHPDHSATSQLLSDLAASLSSAGERVAMVASRQRYDKPGANLPATEEWRGVEIHRIWTSRFGRRHLPGRALDYLTFYLSLPATLWRVVRHGDVVVVKTDPPLVSLVAAVVARLRGAVLVNWLQDVFPEVAVSLREPAIPRPLAWLLRSLRNLSLRQAKANVAIGERMAEYFRTEGVAESQLRVISNWAHEDSIRPLPTESSLLRSELGLTGQFVVGYSGNLGRAHDIDTLVGAMHRLEKNPDVVFLMIGGGSGYEQLRAAVQKLGNVLFRPYQPLERLADSMACADLHLVSLLPELEGMIVPSKFYGIAAAERPAGFVGDQDGEVARWIAQADCGFSVRPGDSEGLATGIVKLARDRAHCRQQGRSARDLLQRRFSRATAMQQWHELLNEMQHPRRAHSGPHTAQGRP